MLDKFRDWGIKIRRDLDRNYYSIWNSSTLKTFRVDIGDTIPLPPENPEFVDVGITERCNATCPFCYVSADKNKQDYTSICETWKRWIDTFPKPRKVSAWANRNNLDDPILAELLNGKLEEGTVDLRLLKTMLRLWAVSGRDFTYTNTVFQIAIGSVGEPTIHPEFEKFLQTVYETEVVPNYTTNGIILSDYDSPRCRSILDATEAFCGGVAVSYGNPSLREQADKAISNLLRLVDVKVMVHHLISDKKSVDDFLEVQKRYAGDIHYHILLPLMKSGRSTKEMEREAFAYLSSKVKEEGITNIALGANFTPYLEKYPSAFSLYEYPKEAYSKNVLLKDGKIIITPNSFNLKILKEL